MRRLALVLTELVTNAVEHGLDGRESGTVDITVERGRGYVSADRNKKSSTIGVVPVDLTPLKTGTVELSSADYLGGKDPVLDAALARPVPPP